ncbi:hypothetical protein PR048_012347 [Dryococelus australis]|uniref:Uncharacterized protein n=1 Tax=Dryococelus australis TaxID=614101 RepID=A0ABQ9HP41_9NEOP|nr:hypothetical protein PR048_012347 [Dryococelus australis]
MSYYATKLLARLQTYNCERTEVPESLDSSYLLSRFASPFYRTFLSIAIKRLRAHSIPEHDFESEKGVTLHPCSSQWRNDAGSGAYSTVEFSMVIHTLKIIAHHDLPIEKSYCSHRQCHILMSFKAIIIMKIKYYTSVPSARRRLCTNSKHIVLFRLAKSDWRLAAVNQKMRSARVSIGLIAGMQEGEKTGDPQENPPTSGIAHHEYHHMRRSGRKPLRKSNPEFLSISTRFKSDPVQHFFDQAVPKITPVWKNTMTCRLYSYSLAYKYADINCTLVVCCHSGRRRLGQHSPGGVKHRVDQWIKLCKHTIGKLCLNEIRWRNILEVELKQCFRKVGSDLERTINKNAAIGGLVYFFWYDVSLGYIKGSPGRWNVLFPGKGSRHGTKRGARVKGHLSLQRCSRKSSRGRSGQVTTSLHSDVDGVVSPKIPTKFFYDTELDSTGFYTLEQKTRAHWLPRQPETTFLFNPTTWNEATRVLSCAGCVVCKQATRAVTGRREIPEKTCRPAVSSSTIPTSENLGVSRPGIEPGSPWMEASSLTAEPPPPPIEVSTGQRRNARGRKTGVPQENPPIGDIFRHNSQVLKSWADPAGKRTRRTVVNMNTEANRIGVPAELDIG